MIPACGGTAPEGVGFAAALPLCHEALPWRATPPGRVIATAIPSADRPVGAPGAPWSAWGPVPVSESRSGESGAWRRPRRPSRARWSARSRFLERLRAGRRSWRTAAWARSSRVPSRPSLPRGGEPARAGERGRRPHGLHRRGRRADRDEHLRSEQPQARAGPARRRVRGDRLRAGCASRARPARSRAATSSSPARSGRSASSRSSTRPSTNPYAAQAQVLKGRGVDLFMIETFFDLDELVVAVEAVRSVSSLPIVALLTFDDEAEIRAGSAPRAAARGSPHSTSRRSGRTTAPARRGTAGAAGDARRRAAAGCAPEHRAREPLRPPGRVPALDAGLLRRVRGPGGRPRRADRRRLLWYDPGPDRGDPRGALDGPRRLDALEVDEPLAPVPVPAPAGETALARALAPASGSSPSSSTRRRAARSTAWSRWRGPCTPRVRSASST